MHVTYVPGKLLTYMLKASIGFFWPLSGQHTVHQHACCFPGMTILSTGIHAVYLFNMGVYVGMYAYTVASVRGIHQRYMWVNPLMYITTVNTPLEHRCTACYNLEL